MPVQLPDISKSLEQLDGQEWGEPEWQSHLVLECHRLRVVPLRELAPADLRIMIGQGIGLEYLAPLAIHALTDDPLLDAELYAGDLLSALLHSEAAFWSAHPDLSAALGSVAESARVRLDALSESERGTAEETLCDAISRFQRSA